MKYTVYQITNNIDGKIYIGCHKTVDINDGYMGSGKILNRAYKKYGVENFTKEFLHIFDSSEEMYAKEAYIVNEDFVNRDDTYNLKVGGTGGWDHVNNDTEFRIAKNRKARKTTDKILLEKYGENFMDVILSLARDALTPESYVQSVKTRRKTLAITHM